MQQALSYLHTFMRCTSPAKDHNHCPNSMKRQLIVADGVRLCVKIGHRIALLISRAAVAIEVSALSVSE